MKWHKISEELPPVGKPVYIHITKEMYHLIGSIKVAYTDNAYWYSWTGTARVTHSLLAPHEWAEIEPPEEVNNDN